MYNGKIIEVFIASPSDIIEEREKVHQLLEEWNIINTQKTKMIFKSLRWEKNIYSAFNNNPQSIINDQALKNADLLIGIFWTRLGTPTEEYESGTVEEIKKHINSNKPAMIYFSKIKVDLSKVDNNQYQKLLEFKKWCQNNAITFDYSDIQDFINKVRTQIGLIINNDRYFKNINKYEDNIEKNQNLNSIETDTINFLNKITIFRKDQAKIHDFIKEIGNYRFEKIVPILETLKILNAKPTASGKFILVLMHGFNNYSKEDIKNIIEDIKNDDFNF